MWTNGIIPSGFIALKGNSFIDERNRNMLREEKYYSTWQVYLMRIFLSKGFLMTQTPDTQSMLYSSAPNVLFYYSKF